MIFKSDPNASELNGFLDRGSRLDGELHFENSFRIDGKLTGKVTSEGGLIVGESGEVDGEIVVGRALVSGTVRGRVRAAQRIQLAPTARVFAELHTPTLIIEEGALFDGRCLMTREDKPREGRESTARDDKRGHEGGAVPKLVKPLARAEGPSS
jgi:cytoskeletal protein CcmA (bactofilin family)